MLVTGVSVCCGCVAAVVTQAQVVVRCWFLALKLVLVLYGNTIRGLGNDSRGCCSQV